MCIKILIKDTNCAIVKAEKQCEVCNSGYFL